MERCGIASQVKCLCRWEIRCAREEGVGKNGTDEVVIPAGTMGAVSARPRNTVWV